MFTLEGPHIVMSRTDAQNRLDFHFKQGGVILYLLTIQNVLMGGGGGGGQVKFD
jgi:hypothetical protein